MLHQGQARPRTASHPMQASLLYTGIFSRLMAVRNLDARSLTGSPSPPPLWPDICLTTASLRSVSLMTCAARQVKSGHCWGFRSGRFDVTCACCPARMGRQISMARLAPRP